MQSSPFKAASLALKRTKISLFSSASSFNRWMTLAFSLFLALLLPGLSYSNSAFSGQTFSFLNPFVNLLGLSDQFDFSYELEANEDLNQLFTLIQEAWGSFFSSPTEWADLYSAGLRILLILLPIVLVITVVLIVLGSFLGSRGVFAYLYSVTNTKGTFSTAWDCSPKSANSLMGFQLLISFVLFPFLLLLIVLPLVPFIRQLFFSPSDMVSPFSLASLMLLIPFILVAFLIFLILSLLSFFFSDFVLPLTYLRKSSIYEGFRVVFKEFLPQKGGEVILYLLFKIVLRLLVGLVIVSVGLFSFGTGFLLMVLPFVGVILLLPASVFLTHYNLSFISGYGDLWNLYAQDSLLDCCESTPDSDTSTASESENLKCDEVQTAVGDEALSGSSQKKGFYNRAEESKKNSP